VRGSHIKLGEGERQVRLGQDSLPNKAEMSGDYIRCFTRTPSKPSNLVKHKEIWKEARTKKFSKFPISFLFKKTKK
jgi:hypothetical protein